MTLLFYTFCALILCISTTSSIKINEIMSNIDIGRKIGSCNAVDILRYNDIFERFTDLQSLASKGRLNGPNPDSVAVQNFNDFMEETTVSDFRFEFYSTDRNKASTPVGPIVYTSRDAYLYGDQDLEIPVLSWIENTDIYSGTINVNGGQFGYVNCDYTATNTATLFSRTVDFLTGERGEYDAMGRTLGNLDQNENGRVDNTFGLVRFETTFNAYKIAAMKVESEAYGTVEVNSFEETAFPAGSRKPRLTANDRYEIQDLVNNMFYFQDKVVLDNGDDNAVDKYISEVAEDVHEDFLMTVDGRPNNKEALLNAQAAAIKTYALSHHIVQGLGLLSYDVSYEGDSVMEDVWVSYTTRVYRSDSDSPTVIYMQNGIGERHFRRTDGGKFENMGGFLTNTYYETDFTQKDAYLQIFSNRYYEFALLIVINIISFVCFCWFNKNKYNKYQVVSDDANL